MRGLEIFLRGRQPTAPQIEQPKPEPEVKAIHRYGKMLSLLAAAEFNEASKANRIAEAFEHAKEIVKASVSEQAEIRAKWLKLSQDLESRGGSTFVTNTLGQLLLEAKALPQDLL